MSSLRLQVRGSQGDLYDVELIRDGTHLRITCTCPAGENGQACKHRLALLDGDVTALVSHDGSEQIAALLADSDVEASLKQLRAAEEVLAAAKSDVQKLKHALSRLMGR